MEKKILVGLDRTISCFNVMHYLCKIFGGREHVKFHLLHIVPTPVAASGKERLAEKERINLLSPQGKAQFAGAQAHMESVVERFTAAGLLENQITTEVRLAYDSVAKDMVQEAKAGSYNALVIGRQGIDAVTEMFVSDHFSTIVEKTKGTPVWIINGHVESNKFLVPVDGSNQTLRAVEHLALMVKDNPQAEITLFNSEAIFAKNAQVNPQDFYEQWSKEWCDTHLTGADALFHAPEQLLIDNEFPRERIQRKSTKSGFYPSRQIVRQAIIGNYGTIVMSSKPEGISAGLFSNVTSKVIGMAEDLAVWVVEDS